MDFLKDRTFLLKVNKHHVKDYYCAILVLDFETEKPISRLEGKVVSGSMTIAANSPTRRTGELTVLFQDDTSKVTNPLNLIQLNKKMKISIGIANPFYHMPEYRDYGDILWFQQGMFVMTQVSVSQNTSGASVKVNFIDKMALLNGYCGGTLPASTSFHDRIIIDNDQNITTEYPLISQIVKEVVHHFGGENYTNIMVDDVPDVGRRVVRYVGDTPINFSSDDTTTPPTMLTQPSFQIGNPPIANFMVSFYKGNLIGYMETDLTYPGELIMKAGSTVTQVLDEIAKTLGNFEYFYDIDGVFHFQQIKTFDRSGNTSLLLIEEAQSDYLPKFNDDTYINELIGNELVQSISHSPKFENIKNDFICWGSRKVGEIESMVRYHLAIDTKPIDSPNANCHRNIDAVYHTETNTIMRYDYMDNLLNPDEEWGNSRPGGYILCPALDPIFPNAPFDWREELYRMALIAWGPSTRATYYDEELMAEWRAIYDPTNTIMRLGGTSLEQQWIDYYGNGAGAPPWHGYNINCVTSPDKIRYWLDLIDTDSPIGAYSVNRIGRRSKVVENNKINEVLSIEIPDLVFIENTEDRVKMAERTRYYISIGQPYCFVTSDILPYFSYVNSYGSCYDEVRQMMYEHLIYNSSMNVVIMPIFYFDVNKKIRITSEQLGVGGDFLITNISWNIGTTSAMTIAMHEMLTVI